MATKVLFLCSKNACRSQMAEALAAQLSKGKVEAHSAGLYPSSVDPRAIQVMKEIGIDISHQTSKAIDIKETIQMNYVITLCDEVESQCPITPYFVQRQYWPHDDSAEAQGDDEYIMNQYRRVRDSIKERVEEFLIGLS